MKRIVFAWLLSALLLTALVGCEHIPDKSTDVFSNNIDTIAPSQATVQETKEFQQQPDDHLTNDNEVDFQLNHEQFEQIIASLPYEYQAILKNEKPYYDTFENDYRYLNIKDLHFAIVDMDGDGSVEVIVSIPITTELVLHTERDVTYGYHFFFRNMYAVYTNGACSWTHMSNEGHEYGEYKISFRESKYEITGLYRILNDGTESAKYYIGENSVSEEELKRYLDQLPSEKVTWYWYDAGDYVIASPDVTTEDFAGGK